MVRILTILEEFVKEIEKDNPYKLVIKGGTALSLFCQKPKVFEHAQKSKGFPTYLNHHRESEDLDFDADVSYLKEYKKIEEYFINILEKLKQKSILKKFTKGKSGLAATNRYHMKLQLETYKPFDTKIDVDFVKMPKNLKNKGELFFYLSERLFITKMVTFIDRKEFKDLYDISRLISYINIDRFKHNPNVINLIDKLINAVLNEDVTKLFKNAFRNVDLRFKDLKESEVEKFSSKTVRNLRILKNKLK